MTRTKNCKLLLVYGSAHKCFTCKMMKLICIVVLMAHRLAFVVCDFEEPLPEIPLTESTTVDLPIEPSPVDPAPSGVGATTRKAHRGFHMRRVDKGTGAQGDTGAKVTASPSAKKTVPPNAGSYRAKVIADMRAGKLKKPAKETKMVKKGLSVLFVRYAVCYSRIDREHRFELNGERMSTTANEHDL